MSLPDELERLKALHERGALTDEEFTLAKKRLLEGGPDAVHATASPRAASPSALSRLHRSLTERWIGGVCGGMGEHTGIPAWSWRILFVLATFLHGLGILMYLLLWIFVPVESRVPAPVAVAKE